jgi:hypothetical protein
MAANGISTLATKQEKQLAKLDIAQLKRRGYTLDVDGTVLSGPDITVPFYRARNEYDINLLPTQYVGNIAVRNTAPLPLQQGRPWIELPLPVYVMIMEDENVQTLETGFDDFVTE